MVGWEEPGMDGRMVKSSCNNFQRGCERLPFCASVTLLQLKESLCAQYPSARRPALRRGIAVNPPFPVSPARTRLTNEPPENLPALPVDFTGSHAVFPVVVTSSPRTDSWRFCKHVAKLRSVAGLALHRAAAL
ncbi:unnamed protein product [Pleuronectes platessa]|uniref:Uncharacterized protein n=1 Tax=Pleuronectes platessa TaxID=8262 RepID=A0A9N7YHI0_PLEPL|nr:unnamed protein product [Pleuronectes platessa]